jgi:hypothetical protein
MLQIIKQQPYFADQGKFRILFHFPGEVGGDHGYVHLPLLQNHLWILIPGSNCTRT